MAKSKLVKANEKIAESVVDGYKKLRTASREDIRKSKMVLSADSQGWRKASSADLRK